MKYTDEEILKHIKAHIDTHPQDTPAYVDYLSCVRNMEPSPSALLQHTSELKRLIRCGIKASGSPETKTKLFDTQRKVLCYEAPHSFDSFLLYNEIDRPIAEQFWFPRRGHLLHICKALQDLENDELDELFLAQPPRTGKSTEIEFFLLWVMGRNSERSNLYCSYTDSVVNVFYNGILEVLQDQITYNYFDIFPKAKIASTNAKDLLINLDRKKRYASFTGRSLYGTLNGACDCNGYLIGDDLISGIEEAQSKDRLTSAWAKVDNNLLPRAKENAKVIWIGTRWSLIDPQGIRIDLLENDPKYRNRRWKVINTPALDPKTDESNFDYAYGVGFTTEYYQQRRASFERNSDMASWLAQYQGEPIEREGAVFNPDELRYYNGVLPEGRPDRIFCAADVAYGGGDFTAAPILYQYDDDFYVVDVIYSNAEKNITQPLFIHAVKKYGIQAMKIEGTRMTAGYGQDIDRMLREEGIRINIQINTSHFTGRGKESRIFDKAPEIREHMIFLAEGHRSKEYQQFLNNLYSFTVTGKNKHDDAPDSCAMAMDFAYNYIAKAEVIKRPW